LATLPVQHSHHDVFSTLFLLESQIIFAVSPLLALGYVLMGAFEDGDAEQVKRKKKSDFNLEGHSE
jgi:hypothetical protein